jgi:hypothetical protein
MTGGDMISIISLWLPILISAVLVFIISSVLHTVFTYHNSDFKKIPSEDGVMKDLAKYKIPPGDYLVPYSTDSKERRTEEFKQKIYNGPVLITTILPNGEMTMGSSLILWFVYCLIVSIISAYITCHALTTGADYLAVFRFAGCTAFTGYSIALMQESIWFKKSWRATIKTMIDGLIYAVFTAGIFGWLWPAI